MSPPACAARTAPAVAALLAVLLAPPLASEPLAGETAELIVNVDHRARSRRPRARHEPVDPADFRSPRRLLPGIQDYWNRKGLISDRGQRKKAFFVLRDFYRVLAVPTTRATKPTPTGHAADVSFRER